MNLTGKCDSKSSKFKITAISDNWNSLFIVTEEEELALAIQMSKADELEVKYDTNEDHITMQMSK